MFGLQDQHILRELERRKILVFTPSRRVAGKRVVCNDDWFIVKLAYESDGIIVSNDMYRDLHGKEPEWKRFIEERLLMYSFVNDKSVATSLVPERSTISGLECSLFECDPDAGLCPPMTLSDATVPLWRTSCANFQRHEKSHRVPTVRGEGHVTGSGIVLA